MPGADAWAVLVEPVLALLLLATFLAVPFAALGAGLRDGRFLASLLVLNFVVVPAVVFGLSRFVAHDDALLVGVLLVLLAPCVDYVIAFTALAGGVAERLLAAAPLLMLVQLVVLPVLPVLPVLLRAFAALVKDSLDDAGDAGAHLRAEDRRLRRPAATSRAALPPAGLLPGRPA